MISSSRVTTEEEPGAGMPCGEQRIDCLARLECLSGEDCNNPGAKRESKDSFRDEGLIRSPSQPVRPAGGRAAIEPGLRGNHPDQPGERKDRRMLSRKAGRAAQCKPAWRGGCPGESRAAGCLPDHTTR
ncbi:MAG: hypothetical protein GXY34_01165 [Syntrophomonadaceae bacterium]|nr:hypothetical protein [Syntrophomonadaceae bacterium]